MRFGAPTATPIVALAVGQRINEFREFKEFWIIQKGSSPHSNAQRIWIIFKFSKIPEQF